MPFVSPEDFAKEKITAIQEYSILSWQAIANLFTKPRYWADIFTQMDLIGVGSLPTIALTGFFTGSVLGLQSASSLKAFGAASMTGNLVALSMVKELGPVRSRLMLAGRNASGMASEIASMRVLGRRSVAGICSDIGSMRVTEQSDAVRALGTNLVWRRTLGTL